MKRYSTLIALALCGIAGTVFAAQPQKWSVESVRAALFTNEPDSIDLRPYKPIDPDYEMQSVVARNESGAGHVLEGEYGKTGEKLVRLLKYNESVQWYTVTRARVLPTADGDFIVKGVFQPVLSYSAVDGRLQEVSYSKDGPGSAQRHYYYCYDQVYCNKYGLYPGDLVFAKFEASDNDVYLFEHDHSLSLHTIGGKCYESDGKPCKGY